jgi:hypothetical protein
MYSRICGDRMSHNIKSDIKLSKCTETITTFLLAISYNLRVKIVRSSEMLAIDNGTKGFLIPENSNFLHISVRKLAPVLCHDVKRVGRGVDHPPHPKSKVEYW